jgi:rSAM/selenodomain-associated transferase 1
VSLDTVAVIVMAKFPQPGQVKTRLVPPLSPDEAAQLQRAFIGHVMGRLARLEPTELVMCFDPPQAARAMAQLVGASATRYLAQTPGDLGARLEAAAREFSKWYGRLLFLGVDSPDVPATHIAQAADLLAHKEIVLGPCDDGGFWCLGLQRHIDLKLLFEGVDWSSGREREQTAQRAAEIDCSCALADPWDDVDRPDDLQRLVSRLSQSADEDDRRLLASLSFLPQGVAS